MNGRKIDTYAAIRKGYNSIRYLAENEGKRWDVWKKLCSMKWTWKLVWKRPKFLYVAGTIIILGQEHVYKTIKHAW